jgi:hypothetical protein
MPDTDPNLDAATICPEDGCHVLVPATPEDRREHRDGHRHRAKVDEAVRGELGKLREALAQLRETNAEFRRKLAEAERPAATGLRIEAMPDEVDDTDDDEPFDLGLDAPDPAAPTADAIGLHIAARDEDEDEDRDVIDLPTFPASRF